MRLSPLRITIIYALFGAAWILFSDWVAASLLGDPADPVVLAQAAKGLGFVVVTGTILYLLLRRREAALGRAVERVSESERRFEHLFAHSPIATWEEDFTAVRAWMEELRAGGVEDLRAYLAEDPQRVWEGIHHIRVVAANPAAERLAKEAGAESADAFPILPEESPDSYLEELVAVWEGRDRVETEVQGRVHGEPVAYLVRWAVPTVGRALDYSRAVVAVTDVSELRRAEQALRVSEQRFRTLAASAPVGIFRTDPMGQCLDANPRFGEILGRTVEEVEGPWVGLFHPGDRAVLQEAWEEAAREGKELALQSRVRTASGAEAWVDLRVAPIGAEDETEGFVGTVTDITAQMEALEARRRLIGILEATPDFVGTATTDGRSTLYLNRAGREMVGIGPDEDVSDRSIGSYLPGWALEIIEERAIPTAFREGIWRGETALLGPDGGEVPVDQVVIAHRRADDGEVAFLSTVARDITDLKAAERRLEELVQAKDEFVASVSHELRTPLTAVVGFAELLAEQSEELGEAERDDLLRLLVRQSHEVAGLVEDLLVAARAEIGKLTLAPRTLDLRSEVEAVLAGIGQGEREADVVVEEGTAQAWADPGRVRQIVRNLLQNAYRYGGPRIRIAVGEREGRSVIRVTDDGPGVPEEDREHIFDPYYRTRQASGRPSSVGLGLTVSRRLARLMEGDLTYRRVEGESVFEVVLPTGGDTGRAADGPDAAAVRRVLEEGLPAMAFQPIYDLRRLEEGSGAVVGFEALARFPDDVGPAAWFAAAGEAGLRLDLELAAIAGAIEARRALPGGAYLALNLSVETLTSPRLLHLTEELGIPSAEVVLEIAQRDALAHYEQVRDAVYGMSALGFRIALDDVGVDEVHLRQLHKLRPDIVKLDIRVVRRVDADSGERGLARAVAALAGVLGAEVVAEGVERPEEVEALLELGVHFGQGYHLGRPAPPETFGS